MLDKHIFCREISQQAGESLVGTVGVRRAWLLLQDHSAWAVQAYACCDLPESVRDHLEPFFGREKPNILLIRNSDEKNIPTRKAFVVVSRNSRAEIYEFDWRQPKELLDIPYAKILAGDYPNQRTQPIYLVCTHGKRDKCCAKYGKPVYDALRKKFGSQVWSASHVGGHRFAANLVCMPHGIFYGRVSPGRALELVQKYEAGELLLDDLRGRSCHPPLTQAAEIFVRRQFDIRKVNQIRFDQYQLLEGDRHRVTFIDLPVQRKLSVDLRVTSSEEANFLSCDDEEKSVTAVYHPLGFAEAANEANADVLST